MATCPRCRQDWTHQQADDFPGLCVDPADRAYHGADHHRARSGDGTVTGRFGRDHRVVDDDTDDRHSSAREGRDNRLAMVVRHARVREGTGHFERRKPDDRPPGRKRPRVALTKSRLLDGRTEEHTSELQSLMRISYAVFCLKKKNQKTNTIENTK